MVGIGGGGREEGGGEGEEGGGVKGRSCYTIFLALSKFGNVFLVTLSLQVAIHKNLSSPLVAFSASYIGGLITLLMVYICIVLTVYRYKPPNSKYRDKTIEKGVLKWDMGKF